MTTEWTSDREAQLERRFNKNTDGALPISVRLLHGWGTIGARGKAFAIKNSNNRINFSIESKNAQRTSFQG
jgi:hypothetical protein